MPKRNQEKWVKTRKFTKFSKCQNVGSLENLVTCSSDAMEHLVGRPPDGWLIQRTMQQETKEENLENFLSVLAIGTSEHLDRWIVDAYMVEHHRCGWLDHYPSDG